MIVRARGEVRPRPPQLAKSKSLFSGALELFSSGDVELLAAKTKEPIDVRSLALADFHALRAIATHEGWLTEEPMDLACTNCDTAFEHAPCAALAMGPFLEHALDDAELDATLAFGEPHPILPLRVGERGRGREAREIVLAPRTVAEVAPLHAALARDGLVTCTPAIVRALGIVALGDEKDPGTIARALRDADDPAFTSVTNTFVLAHYPARLFSVAHCPSCGARHDVDAPEDREFTLDANAGTRSETEAPFPDFDTFAEASRAIGASLIPEAEGIVFLVEGGVAACDDGGDPLLGSYVPPGPGASDGSTPTRPAEISVFYRTFRGAWQDDPAFDWEAELHETIEHELEHHFAYLAGDDPMDDDERRAIADEAAKIYGTREPLRHEARALGRDVGGFFQRTWPIWLLIVVATIAVTLAER
ncbi:MAG: hypothetical protein JWM74_3092 [Myxococcaceae bacterium]|nr:hypothetical protein [Myxococcaceae bacterium]